MAEYMAYDSLEPFGDMRSNWHAANIALILAKAYTPSGRRSPELRDFLWRDPDTRRQEETNRTINFLRVLKGGRSSETRSQSGSTDGEVPAGSGQGESTP